MPWYRTTVTFEQKGVRKFQDSYSWEARELTADTRTIRARVAARPLKGTGEMVPVLLAEIPLTARQYLAGQARKQIVEARNLLVQLDEPVALPEG